MIKAALILEGGALRGVYTSGVLDVLLENKIEFEEVIGVSAGALNGACYVSKQIGRCARINIMHSSDLQYYGLYQFFRNRNAFNFDYLFGEHINTLYPYDKETFAQSEQKFVIIATDCLTGMPIYFYEKEYEKLILALKASCSMPILSKMIEIDNLKCLDGGISEPIGINKAILDGYEKIVIVLTRELNFRKKPLSNYTKQLFNSQYKKYPKLLNKLYEMSIQYNKLLDKIDEMEKKSKY